MSRLTCMVCLVLPITLSGCAGALIVGGLAAMGTGSYAAGQERGIGGAVTDLQIETDVEVAFAGTGPGLKEGITTTVYDGRVLLAGRVGTPEMKAQAVQLASRIAGVRALYDEIEVGLSRDTWNATKDAWITARLRSEFMLDADIRSGNYTIETDDRSVYLIGSARSPAELDRVTRTARNIPGVRRVVSYVELRPGNPVAEQPSRPTGSIKSINAAL